MIRDLLGKKVSEVTEILISLSLFLYWQNHS